MPLPQIQHVFVLMLENRSFDHLLGFSDITGTDAETGAPTVLNGLTGAESNTYEGQVYRLTRPVLSSTSADPGHEFENVLEQLIGPGTPPQLPAGGLYPPIGLSGFVASFVRSGAKNPGEIMRCFDPEQVPVLVKLAREFALCDNWFSSLPGPTWAQSFFPGGRHFRRAGPQPK